MEQILDRNILAEARWPHHCNRGAWGHSCSVWGAALLSPVLRFRLLLWVWQRAEQAELRTEWGPEVKGQHGPSRHLAASWSWETLLGSLDTWERERSGGRRKEHVHQLFLWGSRRISEENCTDRPVPTMLPGTPPVLGTSAFFRKNIIMNP